MKKTFLAILLCLVFLAAGRSSTAFAATTISSIAIENLDSPVAGARPDTTASVSTTGCRIYSVDWYDVTADRFLASSDRFISGNDYQAIIWVEAKDGYEFRYTNSYTPNVSASLAYGNSRDITVNKAYEYNAWAMVEVVYTFHNCVNKEIDHVDIQLGSIEADALIPFEMLSISEGAIAAPELNPRYFPNGVAWSTNQKNVDPGARFSGGKEYFVSIALKPQYNSYGFSRNFSATVNGITATVKGRDSDYAIIEVCFPIYGSIYSHDIAPVVSLPKDGNSPDYGVYYASPQCEHINYASVVGWYDVETGNRLTSRDTFRGNKEYRVKIELMADYPYKFAKNSNGKLDYNPLVTGQEADSYEFGYNDYYGRETITLIKTFTAEQPDHTCVSTPWQCEPDSHHRFCSICEKPLAGGAHWGGEATCASGAKCSVCGYEYTEPHENHIPDTETWVPRAEMYHFHKCKLCGAHCDIEDHRWSPKYHAVSSAGHAYQCADCLGYDTLVPHTPGPAATDDTPQTCTICGYIIAPAKNHTHQLTKVEAVAATCTKTGNIEYYTCSGCSFLFTDAAGNNQLPENASVTTEALGHTPSKLWSLSESHHWHACEVCKEVLEDTKTVHHMTDNICPDCGYDGSPLPAPGENEQSSGEPEPESGSEWIWIAAGAAVVSAGGGGAWLLTKKKRH